MSMHLLTGTGSSGLTRCGVTITLDNVDEVDYTIFRERVTCPRCKLARVLPENPKDLAELQAEFLDTITVPQLQAVNALVPALNILMKILWQTLTEDQRGMLKQLAKEG